MQGQGMSVMQEGADTQKLLPVKPDAIPELLKGLDSWVIWQARAKSGGKFTKVPVDPTTLVATNAHNPANWLSFPDALAAYEAGIGQGIGIVLDGKPVARDIDGAPLFLIGIDLDGVDINAADKETEVILGALRGTYLERSPSGCGLRLFALSRERPRSGQGAHGELYADKRYLTVTGQDARGKIKECTEGVRAVERLLWPQKTKSPDNVIRFPEALLDINRRLEGHEWAETPANCRRIEEALSFVPPDSPYEVWRDCIWALASLGWDCGRQLAEEWSSRSKAHWERDGGAEARMMIASLFDTYDADRGITPGTLYYHAYAHGMPRAAAEFGANSPTPSAPKDGFVLLSRDDLDALPPLRWTVRGVLPEGGLASIFGEPGSGKSFLALDLAARISSGLTDWFGHPVIQRDVIYAALEGGRGIQQRVAAWDRVNGVRADRIKFLLGSLTLLSEEDVVGFSNAVSAASAPGAVVIIDTLAQATPGADENAGKDMGIVIQAAQRIAAAVGGLVILVHHSGKDASRGLRGHSSLNGAIDAVICVERNRVTGRRSWCVTKMKEDDDGTTGMFNLEMVDLGPDAYGGRITSAAVRALSSTEVTAALTAAQAAPKGVHQQAVYDALRAHPNASAGWDLNGVTAVAKGALRDVGSKYRATRAKDALDGLIAAGLIKKNEGGVFFLTENSPDHLPPAPP